jgi:two-component system, OmpR family, phosphate regulon sensor histidine kinase PhoR
VFGKQRLVWRLFLSYILIITVSIGAATWLSTRIFQKFLYESSAEDLEARARILEATFAAMLRDQAYSALDAMAREMGEKSSTRITVILPSGRVVGDTHEDPRAMDSHADRPEVAQALRGRVGVATRYSRTLDQEMMYVGVPVTGETGLTGVLRTSVPFVSIHRSLGSISFRMAFQALLVAVLAAILSLWISRRQSRPLEVIKDGAQRFASGELDFRLSVPESEEMGSLAAALNRMATELAERLRVVRTQRNQLEAVLSSMVEGVVALDMDDRVIRINRAAARMLGCDQLDVKNRSIQEVSRNTELQRFVADTLAAGSLVERDLNLFVGGERTVRAHGTGLWDENRARMGSLIVLDDITRLRRLENMRRDFVANVSHEIKTPITAIKGSVETLQETGVEADPRSTRRFLDIIGRHVDRLEALVEDLLALSRIEEQEQAGGLVLEAGSLAGTLRGAAGLLKERMGDFPVNLEITCDEALAVPMNQVLLEQAFFNLMENAVKYSPPGTQVRVRAAGSEGGAVVRVEDNGAGIPAEHLDRIFERFYRVDKSRSRKLGGTGLGLAIVKHVVMAHGGRVEAESTPGKGSVFTVRLP